MPETIIRAEKMLQKHGSHSKQHVVDMIVDHVRQGEDVGHLYKLLKVIEDLRTLQN